MHELISTGSYESRVQKLDGYVQILKCYSSFKYEYKGSIRLISFLHYLRLLESVHENDMDQYFDFDQDNDIFWFKGDHGRSLEGRFVKPSVMIDFYHANEDCAIKFFKEFFKSMYRDLGDNTITTVYRVPV